MLSILIPTYNYDCQPLVDVLNRQARSLGVAYEIVVFDDASSVRCECHDCRVIRSERNVGRASGRNVLARAARYPYLLFVDSDSMPAREDYLSRYLSRIHAAGPIVLSGGRVYAPVTDMNHSLLPRYGVRERVRRECQPLAPFMSPNFLIDRATMLAHPFDESFSGYGHEDTMFGIELMRAGIRYTVMDNPVRHCHIESNAEFLRKNREALRTLHEMAETTPELRRVSRMVAFSRFMPFRLPLWMSAAIEVILIRHPWVWLLQWYKYLYYNAL